MIHTVQPGESLWSIAQRRLGDGRLWTRIARDNDLADPDHLVVGQRLVVHGAAPSSPLLAGGRHGTPSLPSPLRTTQAGHDSTAHRTAIIPGVSHVFVLADEIDPFRQKVVRRVLVHPRMAADAARTLGRPLALFPNPERYGFTATGPDAPTSMGRHALGMKPSPFSSASTRPLGATRFVGTPFWIDVEAARRTGATLHSTEEILADLDRIAAQPRNAAQVARIREIQALVRADAEVLVRGPVPATAVKGPLAMGLTRSLQGVQVIGFALTAVQLTDAARTSVRTQSVRPIAAEGVRQVGGWAAAWAGMKLGAMGGAAIGLTTGPGAVISAGVGAVGGGLAGYFGFDWIADHIHED